MDMMMMMMMMMSFSDAGMKLVYLIFCDDMVLTTKKKKPYNVMSTDRDVLIKAKHGC